MDTSYTFTTAGQGNNTTTNFQSSNTQQLFTEENNDEDNDNINNTNDENIDNNNNSTTTNNNNNSTNTMNPSLLSSVALLAADITDRFEKTNATLMNNLNSLQNRMNQIEEGTKKVMAIRANQTGNEKTLQELTNTSSTSSLFPSSTTYNNNGSSAPNIYSYVDTSKLPLNTSIHDNDSNTSQLSIHASEDILNKNKISDRTLSRIADLTNTNTNSITNKSTTINMLDEENNNPRFQAALQRLAQRQGNNSNNSSLRESREFATGVSSTTTAPSLPTNVDDFLRGIATRFAEMDAQVARTKPLLQSTDNLLHRT